MRRFVARHRRHRLLAWWARHCERYLRHYHNLDYDFDSNGERFVLTEVARFGVCGPEAVVFDVGANVGNWSLVARTLLPAAPIHAFELIPATFEKLRQALAADPATVANPIGLAARAGELEVTYSPSKPNRASLVPGVSPERADRVTTSVALVTGDAYVAEREIARIGFLKIDTEGAEGEVLSGFRDALAAGRIEVIQFEYGRANVLSRFLLRDFYLLLEPLGYVIGKIYPNYVDFRPYSVDDEDFRGPNYLAVHGRHRGLIEHLRRPPAR